MSSRWPLLTVTLFPTLVQGSEAPAQIAAAVAAANHYSAAVSPLDLLLLARGGGSIEDLWSFNDERVARAVAASVLPVISGVGHETDFTIVDFVADLRAPTPSAAAAAASRNRVDALVTLASIERTLAQAARERVRQARLHLRHLEQRMQRLHPQRGVDLQRQRLDDRQRRLAWAMRRSVDRRHERLATGQTALAALNPLRVLERGYSIVQNRSGKVITDPSQVGAGEELRVRSAGGDYRVRREQASQTGLFE